MERRRTDRQKPARGLEKRTIIYVDTDPGRYLGPVRIRASQRQENCRMLVIVAFYPAVERRGLGRIVQSSQPTLSCRSVIPSSIRDLRNRSEGNYAEYKAMQRYRDQLDDRPLLRIR